MPKSNTTVPSSNSTARGNETTGNHTLRLLQETAAESENTTIAEESDKFMNIQGDNLVADALLAGLALVSVLIAIGTILLCIKYVYPKLPKVLKGLIKTIKAKLMWSSVLRSMT